MEAKHTQGKWGFQHWVKTTDGNSMPIEIFAATGAPHGTVIAELKFDVDNENLSAEAVKANAKLIAAAPELLSALKALEDASHGYVEMATSRNLKKFYEVRKSAIAAIKKATLQGG